MLFGSYTINSICILTAIHATSPSHLANLIPNTHKDYTSLVLASFVHENKMHPNDLIVIFNPKFIVKTTVFWQFNRNQP